MPAGGSAGALGNDGLLYFTGREGTSAYVAAVDACGAVIRESSFLPDGFSSASGSGITLSGSKAFVAGSMVYSSGTNPQDGMYARLTHATLALDYANPLWGGEGSTDEAWSLAIADNGSVWIGGTADYLNPASCGPWAIQADQSGGACGWRAFGAAGSLGRGVLAPAGSGRAYFTGSADGKLTLAAWPTSGCWSTGSPTCPACTSQLDVSATIAGAAYSEGRGLVVVGSRAYVAGFADMGAAANGWAGVVVEIDVSSAQVLNTYAWNPTAAGDMFLGIATDGTALYVGGGQGYDGVTLSTATAVAVKLTLPGMAVSWQRSFADADYYSTPVLDGQGALYLLGTAGGAAHIRRCLTDGTCS
jgi:hypothetical protein